MERFSTLTRQQKFFGLGTRQPQDGNGPRKRGAVYIKKMIISTSLFAAMVDRNRPFPVFYVFLNYDYGQGTRPGEWG